VPWEKITEVKLDKKQPPLGSQLLGSITMTDGNVVATEIVTNGYYRLVVGDLRAGRCLAAPPDLVPPQAKEEGNCPVLLTDVESIRPIARPSHK
jgi:hypothetical protein